MRIDTTWHENMGDTTNGDSITITTTISSFDRKEIDELKNNLLNNIGYALTADNVKFEQLGTVEKEIVNRIWECSKN